MIQASEAFPTPLVLKVWCPVGDSRDPQAQNYFHNDTKMLFAFFTLKFLGVYSGVFPGYMTCDIATD